MRTRLITHHYCDFCKKVKHTRPAMLRHESSCTLNPERKCKMCEMAGFVQKPIAELTAILRTADESNGREKELREAANHCPACILATLRQAPDALVTWSMDWEKESKAWISEHGKRPGPEDH